MNDFRLKIIKTGEKVESDNYEACLAIIKCCRLQKEEVVDRDTAIKRCRGLVNPSNGFIIITAEDIVILSWHKLTKWIDEKGLLPLV